MPGLGACRARGMCGPNAVQRARLGHTIALRGMWH